MTPLRITTNVPVATTTIEAAMRMVHAGNRRVVAGMDERTGGIALLPCGSTPPGTSSSAVRMRDAAAIIPRASATFTAHSVHRAACSSALRSASASSAPSSHAWIVPSSRCRMSLSPARLLLQRLIMFDQPASRPRERGANRAYRQFERLRDLLVVEPLFAHQQREPIAFGERIHRAPRHRRVLSALGGERRGLHHFVPCLLTQQLQVAPA